MDIREKVRAVLGREFEPPPVALLVGFAVTDMERGSCVVEMDAGRDHHNPMGTVHGGVLTDIADAAMGMACATVLERSESFTTLELKMNFFRPVFEDHLRAAAEVLHRGRSVVVVECAVTNREGKLVAKGLSTCQVIPAGAQDSLARERR